MLEKSTNLSDKMMLLTSKELLKAAKMNFPGGAILANAMMELFRYNELNEVYSSIYNNDPEVFVDSVFEKLGIRFEIDEKDLDNIPADGPLITISNHPFGGIDSLILTKILLMRRPDFKIMGNFLLQRITPLKDHILPVNPFENMKEIRSSFPGLRSGISYLNNNHLLGIFPAGEVSTYRADTHIITDREWQISVLKFIHHSRVPVIPVYFHGSNSVWFHTLAMIHPALRTIKLPSELLNKKNKLY